MKKIGCIVGGAVVLVVLIVCIFKFYWVFGEGVKAGELNYFMKKGVVFKTFEGRIIQAGIKGSSGETNSGIQSNEFTFSVEDPAVGDSLMRCSGRNVELHYKEYLGALPWRGMSENVVDSIISVSDATGLTVR